MTPIPDPLSQPLPTIRDDLKLLPGPRARDGSPTWTIHDPIRNRYHRLGWLGFEMLARWGTGGGTGQALCERVRAETPLAPGAAEVEALVHFLRANMLIDMRTPADRRFWMNQIAAGRSSWGVWLLHHYLFLRIPLIRPDPFLRWAWPLVRPLFSRPAALLMAGLGLCGLFLVARQWDAFRHTFTQFATLEGVVWMALALGVSKVLHEFGHAFTAHRFGCRIPSMGVAFLVLWPVLYTDTSDAWRLTERRQRLAIGAAGVLVELGVAALATLVWVMSDDGPLRSAAFFLATAGWTASVLVNLSPFLRFDGYYLLSDFLDEPNLQPRAFGLGRWAVRELLFGFGEPPPEPLPRARRRLLIVYAWATWAYRLVLFLGIALLVYHFFIKILGIFLFLVEVGWFILKPVTTEVVVWWHRRKLIRFNRHTAATGLVLLGLGGALFVPWRTTLPLPAVLEAVPLHEVHAPEPARVARVLVAPGERVTVGQALVLLSAPDLDFQLRLVELRLAVNRLTLDRTMTDEALRGDTPLLTADQHTLLAQQAGLLARRARLTLVAGVDGVVRDVLPELRPDLWVSPRAVLLRVIGNDQGRITAYADQEVLGRLSEGALARFHPDDALAPSLEARVTGVETINRPLLDHPMLASTQGGPLAAREEGHHRVRPEGSIYRVAASPLLPLAPPQVRRGTLRVVGKPESLAWRAARTVASVVIRESGF